MSLMSQPKLAYPRVRVEWARDRLEFYSVEVRRAGRRSAFREWRWRCVAANRRIVGASTESYVRLKDACTNARRQCQHVPFDRWKIVEE